MPRLVIRRATPDDAQAIHEGLLGIGDAIGLAGKITSTVEDIRRYGFGTEPRFHSLIAEVGADFAGMSLYFMIFSTWRGRRGGYLQDLFVAERFRGHGVAEGLMIHTARAVAAEGGAFMSLAVDKRNLRAQAFYAKLGMHPDDSDFILSAEADAFSRLVGSNGGESAG